MLQKLVVEKMQESNLSLREAAKFAGVSHSTLFRVVNGGNADISTLTALSKWLDVSLPSLLNSLGDDKDDLATKVAMIVEAEPGLGELLRRVIAGYQTGELTSSDLNEIVSYASYRLSLKGK